MYKSDRYEGFYLSGIGVWYDILSICVVKALEVFSLFMPR